jgi:hypothetical protein
MNAVFLIIALCQLPEVALRFAETGSAGPQVISHSYGQCVRSVAFCYQTSLGTQQTDEQRALHCAFGDKKR